jgi:hypothetical protein
MLCRLLLAKAGLTRLPAARHGEPCGVGLRAALLCGARSAEASLLRVAARARITTCCSAPAACRARLSHCSCRPAAVVGALVPWKWR